MFGWRPPTYHLAQGFGFGVNSWLIHFEGGEWCSNATTCLERKHTWLGSSKEMAKQIAFSGILSDTIDYNPAFYNWNKVKVCYYDGSSLTGDMEEVDPATKLQKQRCKGIANCYGGPACKRNEQRRKCVHS